MVVGMKRCTVPRPQRNEESFFEQPSKPRATRHAHDDTLSPGREKRKRRGNNSEMGVFFCSLLFLILIYLFIFGSGED
jgi:hypothetical protein